MPRFFFVRLLCHCSVPIFLCKHLQTIFLLIKLFKCAWLALSLVNKVSYELSVVHNDDTCDQIFFRKSWRSISLLSQIVSYCLNKRSVSIVPGIIRNNFCGLVNRWARASVNQFVRLHMVYSNPVTFLTVSFISARYLKTTRPIYDWDQTTENTHYREHFDIKYKQWLIHYCRWIQLTTIYLQYVLLPQTMDYLWLNKILLTIKMAVFMPANHNRPPGLETLPNHYKIDLLFLINLCSNKLPCQGQKRWIKMNARLIYHGGLQEWLSTWKRITTWWCNNDCLEQWLLIIMIVILFFF